jgi:hypothetical protein
MVTTCEIAKIAKVKVVDAAGDKLIKNDDACAFLKAALEVGATIIGMEGFYVKEGLRVPDMAFIADFSDIQDSNESIDSAIKLLSQLTPREDYYLDFVFR